MVNNRYKEELDLVVLAKTDSRLMEYRESLNSARPKNMESE